MASGKSDKGHASSGEAAPQQRKHSKQSLRLDFGSHLLPPLSAPVQCAACPAVHSHPVEKWSLSLGTCEVEVIRDGLDQRSSPGRLEERPRGQGDQSNKNPKLGVPRWFKV